MRTTVTLEEDVDQRLRRLARERGISFKQAINEVARRGLDNGVAAQRPFKVEAQNMGLRPGIDLTKANQIAAQMEDAEIIRKMRLGK